MILNLLIKAGGPAPQLLLEVDVPVVTDEDCANAYANNNLIVTPSMICAGNITNGEANYETLK